MTRSSASLKMAGLVPAIARKGSGHRALVLAGLGFLLLSASVSLGQQLQPSRVE
ncbi:MAG: hypothetical protein HY613_11460, partial [Candidatus Rokubacteria bacterium]|nr:hypothetical protein [Candidatus Rokubacteria bacterium]